ncbi:hypothetical protein [Coleofasciculus sp. H7-2]
MLTRRVIGMVTLSVNGAINISSLGGALVSLPERSVLACSLVQVIG